MIWIINQTYGCPGLGTKIVAVLDGDTSPDPLCRSWWEANMIAGSVMDDVPPIGPVPTIKVEKRGKHSRLPTGEMEDVANPCDVEYVKHMLKRIAVMARWYGLDARDKSGNPQGLNAVLVAMLVKDHGFKKVHYISMDPSERLGLV